MLHCRYQRRLVDNGSVMTTHTHRVEISGKAELHGSTQDHASNPGSSSPQRAVIIGMPANIVEVQQQLALLPNQPRLTGVVTLHELPATHADATLLNDAKLNIIGVVDDLETLLSPEDTDIAIISLPASLSGAIQSIRTRLRRLGIVDRYIPPMCDMLAGVGPRSMLEINVGDLIDRTPHVLNEDAVRHTIRGKRVLVTGAGGSIGSELTMQIAQFEPSDIFLMERGENALFEIDRRLARSFPSLRRGTWLHDVTDADKTLEYCIASKPDIIFHTAAHKHVPMMEGHPRLAVQNNFFGTKAIADAAAQTGCGRFVMISTDKAVMPTSIMGATKRLAELYVQYLDTSQNTAFEIVRFGNVLASAGSVLNIWKDQIREGGPVSVTDPDMTRYFMTIPEAAVLVTQTTTMFHVTNSSRGSIHLLDMGEPINVLDLAARFIRAHGLEPTIAITDDIAASRYKELSRIASISDVATSGTHNIPIIFTGARPGEKLHEDLLYTDENVCQTAHPGIRRLDVTPPTAESIGDLVATLNEACETGSDHTVVTALERLLSEEMVEPIITVQPMSDKQYPPSPHRRKRNRRHRRSQLKSEHAA